MKPIKHPIRTGESCDDVELLHSVLVYLGEQIDEMERIVSSYGPSTAAAVTRARSLRDRLLEGQGAKQGRGRTAQHRRQSVR